MTVAVGISTCLFIARISESICESIRAVRVCCGWLKVEEKHVCWSVLRTDTALHHAAHNACFVLFWLGGLEPGHWRTHTALMSRINWCFMAFIYKWKLLLCLLTSLQTVTWVVLDVRQLWLHYVIHSFLRKQQGQSLADIGCIFWQFYSHNKKAA